MYPNLTDIKIAKLSLDYIVGNCVYKARAAKSMLIDEGWPEEKLDMVNCRTEKQQYHRVLIINHEGYQYLIDNRLGTVMILDDVPYTGWYGGIGLN